MSKVKRSKRKSENSLPDFKEHKKYLLAMDQEELVDILEAAWNNKNRNVQECITEKIIELKKEDWWLKVENQTEMLEKNWIFEDELNESIVRAMCLKFKDDDIKLGYHQETIKQFVLSDGDWNDDEELVFTVEGGGCQEDGASNEGFILTLEESYDKLTRRIRVEQNVECCCYDEYDDKADENTFFAHPEEQPSLDP